MSRYIDADALKKLFAKDWRQHGMVVRTIEGIIRDIDNFPTADVRENVHGEWIEDTKGVYTDNRDVWECSECGEPLILLEGTPKENKYNFCPNCGADMR